MAGLRKATKNGKESWRLSFGPADKRTEIRLGAIPTRAAELIRVRVEQLEAMRDSGLTPTGELREWLSKISDKLTAKLARAGLIDDRKRITLAAWLDQFVGGLTGQPNTIRNWKQTRRLLVNFLGDVDLREITSKRATEWRQNMATEGYAIATQNKETKRARQLFKAAIASGYADSNPFTTVKAGAERNDTRLKFIDVSTIEKVLNACPDAEWRAIVTLSRFAGLRCPSETLRLRWSDIDWASGTMTVSSPKTAGQGKAFRTVPLFPRVRQALEELDVVTAEKTEFVIQRYRDANNSNLRTQFLRIARRAGVTQWERAFHNLRASCQIELCDRFPGHVAARWLGNSEAVANKHYLTTNDEHFKRAVSSDPSVQPNADQVGGQSGGQSEPREANQAATNRSEPKPREREQVLAGQALMRNDSHHFATVQYVPVPPRGFEPRFSD